VENGRALQDPLVQADRFISGLEACAFKRIETQVELSRGRATARQISSADVELMRQGVRVPHGGLESERSRLPKSVAPS
jgi:hypothetical protein